MRHLEGGSALTDVSATCDVARDEDRGEHSRERRLQRAPLKLLASLGVLAPWRSLGLSVSLTRTSGASHE